MLELRAGSPAAMRGCLAGSVVIFAALSATMSVAQPYEGRWIAGDASYSQSITIRKAGPGRLTGDFSVGIRGCGGELKAVAEAGETVLVFQPRPGEDAEGAACRVTARRKANRLEVSEEGCLTFHGAACEFSGTYRRIGR